MHQIETPPTTDVVIPVYGKFELTQKCLHSLARQTMAHTVIVVDDGSPDDTVARLACEWPAVVNVELGTNQGYAAAVNAGVSAGTGRFVVILNNDVELEPGALAEMVRPMMADPGLGSVASVMLRPGGQTIDSAGICADVTLAGFPRLRGRPASAADAPRPRLACPDGNAGAYRREAWEQVSGFDTHITAYLEVLDLGLRLSGRGWKCSLATAANGIHLGSATFGARSPHARLSGAVSRGYMLRRWGLLKTSAALRALATEILVVVADCLLSRDLTALIGRVRGWRSAGSLARHPHIPDGVADRSISAWRSIMLRREG